jgi:hypothetical protein
MIDKLLRPFIPDQLKALCEKLETQEFDTRSLQKIAILVNDLDLTFFERYVVRRVYKRVMEEIIIGQSEYDINMDINAKLRASMDSGVYTGTMAAQQAAMWNGRVPQPEPSKRVIVRPRATNP